MEVIPEQAEVVKRIYRDFLAGKSPSFIARTLTSEGVPSPAGKEQWRPKVVESILTNEKYKGDALLQKTYSESFLSHKRIKNDGELPSYYVARSHEAIIDPAIFEEVQIKIKARKGARHYTPHDFSGIVYCADCGGLYGSKEGRGDIAWRCNRQHRKITRCTTHQISNKRLEDAFVMAFNKLIEGKEKIYEECQKLIEERYSTEEIEKKIEKKQNGIDLYLALEKKEIKAAGKDAEEKYDEMKKTEYQLIREKVELECKKAQKMAKKAAISEYIKELRNSGHIVEFDSELMHRVVERIEVKADGLKVIFLGGQVIEG